MHKRSDQGGDGDFLIPGTLESNLKGEVIIEKTPRMFEGGGC